MMHAAKHGTPLSLSTAGITLIRCTFRYQGTRRLQP